MNFFQKQKYSRQYCISFAILSFIQNHNLNLQYTNEMKDFSTATQSHKLKIHLIFHQIQLTVKFQCHIVLALKSQQNKIVSQTTPKPLTQGKCEISQQILIDWEAQYNSSLGQYISSNLQIFVLVHAANGVIHAGLCTIDVTKSLYQSVLPLKKCSDKTATITLSCSAQYSQTAYKNYSYVEHTYNGDPHSGYYSREKKITRFKSQENRLADSQFNQSLLSISKISLASNKKVQKFLRGENQQLSKQNEQLRQKVKRLQRKEKQNFLQLKESLNKMQKMSNRCNEAQGLNQLNEMLLVEKEKCIKGYENQLNRLEQIKKDYFQQINALQEKLYSKQESFHKQAERYSEKIEKLQEQLQKANNSYLSALNKYQEFEQNSSNVNKQKQLNFQLQRAKNNKQIKYLQELNAKIELENKVYKTRINELQQMLQKERDKESFKSLIRDKDQIIQKLSHELEKLKMQKMQIQEELIEIRSGQQDRLNLKKKIAQCQSQCNNYKSQLQKYTQNILLYSSKNQQLISTCEKIEKQKKELLTQLETLKTELNLKKRQLLNQQNQHTNLKEKLAQLQAFSQNSKVKYTALISQQRKEVKALRQQIKKMQGQKQIMLFERNSFQENSKKTNLLKEELYLKVKILSEERLDEKRQIQTLKTENYYYQQSLVKIQAQHQSQVSLYSGLLKWLIQSIQSEAITEYAHAVKITDDQLRQSLLKSMKNRNYLIQKRKRDYESLIQQKTFIELQLQKLGRRYDECEKYYQEQLRKEKEERDAELKEYIQQKNKLLDVLMEMQSQKLQMSSLKEQYYKQCKLLELRVEENEKDIEHYKDLSKQLEEKFRKQNQTLTQMTKYYEELFGHTQMQQKELETQKQKLWQVQKERNELLVTTLKDILNSKEEELKNALKFNQQLQQKLVRNQSQNKKLEFDLSVQLHLYEQLQVKANQLSLQNNQLKNGLRDLETEIETKQKQMSQKQLDLSERSAKSIQLQDRFQHSIAEVEKKREELEHQLQKMNEQINEWKYKVKLLEDQRNNQKKIGNEEVNKLIQDLSIYKILMEQAQNTIARLQKEKQQLKEQKSQRNQKSIQEDVV